MKEALKKFFPGWAVTAFLLLADIIFIFLLANIAWIPLSFLLLGSAFLLLLVIGVFWLTKDFKRKIRFIIGCVLTVVIIAVEILGIYYIRPIDNTIDEITAPKVEYAEFGVYVRKDDPAKKISDAKDYNFGILEVLDRDATALALENLKKELGKAVTTKDYAGVGEMLDGLLKEQQADAILLNKSFIDILTETEGHGEDLEKIRELYSIVIENSVPSGEAVPQLKETFTMYISGIDCSGSITRRSRSDVNIIATVNTKTGQVLLVSTPRDYFVPLSISNGIPDKLTHAGIYGINVSKDTLGLLYDTEIDYYFRVNFDGFKGIIDALGGIEVQSEYAFNSGRFSYNKGSNFLNGDSALAFARQRYAFAAGDRQRGKNQMAVIKGVINKAASPALLKNYTQVLEGIAGSFETSIPYDAIAELVQTQLKKGTKWNVVSYSVDGTGTSRKPYSLSSYAYVMIPNEATVEHAKELMQQVKDGEIPTP